MISSLEVERELAAGREVLQQREDVAGVELARVERHHRRQVREADDRDALADGLDAGLRELAVAAGLGGEIDDAAAGAHVRDGGGGDQPRSGAAGDQRRRDHDVEVGQPLLERRLLGRLLLGRELLRVAALGLLALHAELEEPGAERLDLLLHRRAHVERGDDGAEPPRGRDRLQARDAGAHDRGRAPGAIVPAAVISIGKSLGTRSAAISTAL